MIAPRPDVVRMSADEAARLSRWAFWLSLVWPVFVLSLMIEIPPFTELSRAFGALVVYAAAIVAAIVAIRIGRRVRKAGVPARTLAACAEVLAWIEISLSTIGIIVIAALAFLWSRSDWTF